MHRLLMLMAFLFVASGSISASPLQPSESDHAKFIRLTRQLEREPLGDSDKSIRAWLLQWATESKDVTVLVCDILGPIPEQDLPHGGELLLQMLFGNAAFQISQPDRKSDLSATQIAGVRSSMEAYRSILAKHPQARIPYFDELLSKDQAGTLEAFLTPMIADKCSERDGA